MKRTRFYRFITIACFAFCAFSCASKAETESITKLSGGAPPSEVLVQAENLFRRREDIAKLREAVKLLASVRSIDNRVYEIEWQFARFNYFLGKQSTDEKESEKAFTDGVQAGKIAANMEPKKPEGHFWYGANLGEQAKRNPITIAIKSIDNIRETMNKVIELEPGYQMASAYVALAQVELKSGWIGGGKPEKAVKFLEKALELEKNNTYIYLNLAEAYLAVGRDAEAKKHLEYLLKSKPNPDYVFEHRETTARAKKLLETRF